MADFDDTTDAATSDPRESNSLTLGSSVADSTTLYLLAVRETTGSVVGTGIPEIELNDSGEWGSGAIGKPGDTVKLRMNAATAPDTAREATLYACSPDGGFASFAWTVTT